MPLGSSPFSMTRLIHWPVVAVVVPPGFHAEVNFVVLEDVEKLICLLKGLVRIVRYCRRMVWFRKSRLVSAIPNMSAACSDWS